MIPRRANHECQSLDVDHPTDCRSAASMRPFPVGCGWYSANMDKVGCGKGRGSYGWRYPGVVAITVTWTLGWVLGQSLFTCFFCCHCCCYCAYCHSGVQHSTVQHSTVQHSTVQHSTAQLGHPLGCDVMRGILQQPRFTTNQDLSNSFLLLPSSI